MAEFNDNGTWTAFTAILDIDLYFKILHYVWCKKHQIETVTTQIWRGHIDT